MENNKENINKTISVNDLLYIGDEEFFYEAYECPECNNSSVSKEDNYCSNCGVKILKD